MYYDRGMVVGVRVNNKPTTKDGFVFVYTKNTFLELVGVENRFSYTLSEFQAIDFLEDLPGINLYFADYENATLNDWDALSASERSDYNSRAAVLISKKMLVPYWPEPERFTSPLDGSAPVFSGIETITPVSNDRIDITWSAAEDDVTPQSKIIYNVYIAEVTSPATPASVRVSFSAAKTSADLTGLINDPTTFSGVVNVNGNPNAISVAGQDAQTISDLIDEINLLLTGAIVFFDETNDEIVFETTAEGVGNTISITDTDLFSSLSDFDSISTPIAGSDKVVPAIDYNNPAYTTIAGVTSNACTFLKPGSEYYIGVRAEDRYGNEDTNTVTLNAVTTSAGETTPPTFAGAEAAVAASVSEITLSWEPATDNSSLPSQIVYDIYYATSSGGQTFLAPPQHTTTPGSTSYVVPGLDPATTYYFVVRARDVNGNFDTNVVEVNATTL